MESLDALLQQHAPDEARVQAALVAAYGATLYRLAYSLLGAADDAQDAVQETLLVALRRLADYTPGTNLRAWLFAICLNVCRGIQRRAWRRQRLAGLLGRRYQQEAPAPGPEEQLIRGESHRQLWAAVRRLPEAQRLAVILVFIHELPVQEVAEILGVPPKTVYSRLYAAFRRMRGLLARESLPPAGEAHGPKEQA
jgi:RNA polymerase sigma-70 factor (ECF subfamily)